MVVSGSKRLDFCAFTLILVLSVLLCWGMKETKTVNNCAPFSAARNQQQLQLHATGLMSLLCECVDGTARFGVLSCHVLSSLVSEGCGYGHLQIIPATSVF